MSLHAPTITTEAAKHVLGFFGQEGGQQPGTFHEYLIHTIESADPVNRDKLALGFPDYVAAAMAVAYDPDGIQHLQRIAGREVAA